MSYIFRLSHFWNYYGMGIAFIEVCKAVKVGKLKESNITSKEGKAMFKEYFTSFAKTKLEELS